MPYNGFHHLHGHVLVEMRFQLVHMGNVVPNRRIEVNVEMKFVPVAHDSLLSWMMESA